MRLAPPYNGDSYLIVKAETESATGETTRLTAAQSITSDGYIAQRGYTYGRCRQLGNCA